MSKFPNISAGVVVMKVEEDSPAAHCSTIHAKDVIVACDGKLVRSKLEVCLVFSVHGFLRQIFLTYVCIFHV